MGTAANDWHPPAAYLYALTLDGPALAWEYLRRNRQYQDEYGQRSPRRSASPLELLRSATPWSLRLLEDPARDARTAQPDWLLDPEGFAQLHPSETSSPNAETFALWHLPGRKQLAHDGQRLVLTLRHAGSTLRLALSPALEDGMAYAYAVTAGKHLRERWQAAAATLERLEVRDAAPPSSQVHDRPNHAAQLHMRSLQALDGIAAGASQREIAQALFGAAAVAERWHDDGDLRAQVRRLIRRGQSFAEGGYRRLLHGPPLGDGRSR